MVTAPSSPCGCAVCSRPTQVLYYGVVVEGGTAISVLASDFRGGDEKSSEKY